MKFNHFYLLILFGIFLQAVFSQIQSNNAVDEPPVIQAEQDPNSIDVAAEQDIDSNSVLAQLGQVQSLDEFMGLLQIDGRPVTSEDIFDDLTDEDGKQVIAGGGRLAVADNCSPRNTTIRIIMEETESDYTYFPRCTKIERCGGCCSSPSLECRPHYTERVILNVLKARVPYPGATHLNYIGFAPVIVDRHMTCRVVCTLTEASCGPQKQFSQIECACKCRLFIPCPPPTTFDDDDCTCKCPRRNNCCPNNSENCGMVLNNRTCECVLAVGKVSISQVDSANSSGSGTNNQSPNSPGQTGSQQGAHEVIPATTPTTTTTSTTTTTTTTRTTTARRITNPCLLRSCPPRFAKIRRGNMCLCRPPLPRFRRPG